MKKWIIAGAAVVAMETAAIACSCIATDDPVELQRFASRAAEDAVALVEAEALTSFEATRTGERMRVVNVLAGSAPAEFRIERGASPSSASCDVLYRVGERATVILYPAALPSGGLPTYRTSGLCSVHMLDKPVYRDTIIRSIAASGGERG